MFDIKENLKKLPTCPGVYMHKDSLGQVIYVGKAINLRNRVRQYFQTYGKSTPKLRALTGQIAEFEYITCASEMEAFILECNLIKKYQPKYNILLRDDKTYPYIMITTSEPYPRVLKTRKIRKDKNRYFGPYSDVGAVNNIIELFSNIYSLKRCKDLDFPEGFRPCLNYHIKDCKGICLGNVSREEYGNNIKEIIQFLSGKDKPMLDYLQNKMMEASDALDFENAAKYRDYISSLKSLEETQRVTIVNGSDFDIVLPVKVDGANYVSVFPVRKGRLSGRESFPIQSEAGDTEAVIVGEFIKQYYSRFANVPHEIIVAKEPAEKALLETFLSAQGHKVTITVPQRGEKRALLMLAIRDSSEMTKSLTERAAGRKEREATVRREIGMVVRAARAGDGAALDNIDEGFDDPTHPEPYRVESYDISNTAGVDSVGAMVVFSGLERVRKDYRRFKIKTIEGPNDYGSLQEVLYRRYKRALEGDPAFKIMPDIILIDGGQGQVNAAKKILDALGVDVPVAGMAKDDKHRTRAIVFSDGREISLKGHQVLFTYCGTVQEEVHRFAIDYHHQLHTKSSVHSVLDNIEGIGPKRRNELLAHFKTVDNISKASVEELEQAPGMNSKAAESVYSYFRKHGAGRKTE
ncbi:MAG: excinuclease ABC subunit UvrC [Eubacteriales bacterium]|nr:excinuclease ABC subunit UvrC [Eubacteriales bacterium]